MITAANSQLIIAGLVKLRLFEKLFKKKSFLALNTYWYKMSQILTSFSHESSSKGNKFALAELQCLKI
jgi:hypothetical protein